MLLMEVKGIIRDISTKFDVSNRVKNFYLGKLDAAVHNSGLQLYSKIFQHRYFPVNFGKVLRSAFLDNFSWRLLLGNYFWGLLLVEPRWLMLILILVESSKTIKKKVSLNFGRWVEFPLLFNFKSLILYSRKCFVD